VLRLGLVGCGRLAEVGYLPAIGRTSAFDLVAVADPDARRRRRLSTLAGDGGRGPVPAFATAADLLAGTELDALVLASPAEAHVADAAAAAEAGVAVLVEKPPAPGAAGAAALAALVPAPAIGFNRRFDPAVRALRDGLPTTGDLTLDLVLHYRRQSWRAAAVQDDALVDLGPHLVDWARWLTGSEVVSVTARVVEHERATIELELTRGRARLDAAADRLHREAVDVHDADDRRVARHRVGGPLAAVTGRLGAGPHPLVTSLAAQLDAFASTVAGRPSPDLGTAADGLAVMAVLDAARASAAAGGAPRSVTPVTRS
jgi:predicted dehydrogenase